MQEKNQQEKSAAERQVELLVNSLERAKQNGGVWLNPSGKKVPRLYQKAGVISPFNELNLALHSDQNGYKTNEYTLFCDAKKRGESVQSHEKGVPFNWYNWNEYVNRHDSDDRISRDEYKSLAPDQQAQYKGVRVREVRTLFNIDQTTLPFTNKESYQNVVKEHGSMESRGDADAIGSSAIEKVSDLIAKSKENLVQIHLDGSGVAHYDTKKDTVYLPSESSYSNINDYANDAVRQIVAATGHQQRLSRQGLGRNPSEDARKQEQLVAEIAKGVKLLEMGLPAKLSPESMKMADYWQRELKENPCLIDIVEKDVNNAVDMIHKAERGETVTKSAFKGQQATFSNEVPKHFFIADGIKDIPNKDTKEFVLVKDLKSNVADVVLPEGASVSAENEIPGMNKNRIESALKKEGIDTVTFYNVDGSHGYRHDDSYFADKDVTVAKLSGWDLKETARLDVTDAVRRASSMNFDKVLMMKTDEGKWALFLKPENEKSFSIIPSKEDLNRFFVTIKQGNDENTDIMRNDLAQKYYIIAGTHPELKTDIFKSKATPEELAKIERVNIFRTKESEQKPSSILCMPVINGEKQKPREVSPQQWQRMWLADDMRSYKTHLAATLFADVLRQGKDESVGLGTDKTEQEAQTDSREQQHAEFHEEIEKHEEKEEQAHADYHEEKDKSQTEEEKKEEEKKEEKHEEKKKSEITPLLRQFLDLKKKHPDALLLFRTGDFYETYKEDAEKASKILGITLTKSTKTKDEQGKPLAMAGFPYHALDAYLPRLIRAGQRVAICDQIEAPKQTARRGLTETVSSGTAMDKEMNSRNAQKSEASNEVRQGSFFHR